MRSYPFPVMRFESDSNRDYRIITKGARDSYLRNPSTLGRPLEWRDSPWQQAFYLWPNFLERETSEKKRENRSPANPIPIQPRYAHALRIVADTNQPLTRAPTRTPCGEAGSEGSWLRVLGRPTKSKPTVRPNRQPMWVQFIWIKVFDYLLNFSCYFF